MRSWCSARSTRRRSASSSVAAASARSAAASSSAPASSLRWVIRKALCVLMLAAPPRTRRRLSRTFSRARWPEYRALLEEALRRGYALRSLETWVASDEEARPTLILRHDVDQHPASVLPMLEIECDLGVRATWYFRWRTADARIIARVRAAGGDVGLHYETLTRLALERGTTDAASLVPEAREELRQEVVEFKRLFGSVNSLCAHGDTRIPSVRNAALLADQDAAGWGVEFDANAVMRGRALAMWLTDRSSADGRWKDGVDPWILLAASETPILCLTHPNNWVSGPGLWLDRALAAALPVGGHGASRRVVRTGRDEPPVPLR